MQYAKQTHCFSKRAEYKKPSGEIFSVQILSFESGIILTLRNDHGQTPFGHRNVDVDCGVDC